MRTRVLLVGVVLFTIGFALGIVAPSTEAQAVGDPCAAPWVVEHGHTRPFIGAGGGATVNNWESGGFYAFKLNRCTGDVQVFATDDGEVGEKDTWYTLGVKP